MCSSSALLELGCPAFDVVFHLHAHRQLLDYDLSRIPLGQYTPEYGLGRILPETAASHGRVAIYFWASLKMADYRAVRRRALWPSAQCTSPKLVALTQSTFPRNRMNDRSEAGGNEAFYEPRDARYFKMLTVLKNISHCRSKVSSEQLSFNTA